MGALCPGGSRLWPRPGYWAASDAVSSVSACLPPNPTVKCVGWNVSSGSVECGPAYLAGSLNCGACAPGYFLPGDGSCAPCPVVAGTWDKYRELVLLLTGVLATVGAIIAALAAVAAATGVSLAGLTQRALDLALWSIAALQTVSQAAPASAAALPPVIIALFRGLAVLQLDGVLLPPACTGAYAFESQVRLTSRVCAASWDSTRAVE